MPGAGTDKTKRWIAAPGPLFVLVKPQLGENIGAAARAMANFGLSELRLVQPREDFPNERTRAAASGADRVLDAARVYGDLGEAIADCTGVFALTARAHDQAKPVVGAQEAAALIAPRVAAGEKIAFLFGRERWGLENDEIALADHIVTLPVNPAFASLNLAQAVVVVAYEWFKLVTGGALPFATPHKSPPVAKQQLAAFFDSLERELDKVEFFRPPEKKATMLVNLRNIFNRMEPTQQDIQTLHGVVMAIAEGRKGPAKGGVLDTHEAEALRAILAAQGQVAGQSHARGGRSTPFKDAPTRGLARLLRRNPTDAERALWEALCRDRRFAGRGFKRQVPIGPHIADFVSFPLRMVIDVAPAEESEAAANARAQKREWMEQRGYALFTVEAGAALTSTATLLDELDRRLSSAVMDAKGER